MTDENPTGTTGIVLRHSRLYDLVAGPLVRRSDAAILDLAQVGTGDRVLDVGTGPGYLALAAVRRVGPSGRAVGIDPSPAMIERARTRARGERPAPFYRVAAAEALPFEDDWFDAVVSRLVFHHLVNALQTQALREIARVLRPGGRLVIADISAHRRRGGHHWTAHVAAVRPTGGFSLQQAVREAGFTEIATTRLSRGLLFAVTAVNPGPEGVR